MKAYTDLEQSKKLAEILPLESADMCYEVGEDLDGYLTKTIYTPLMHTPYNDNYIPCWSLAALLGALPDDCCGIDKEDGKYAASYVVSNEGDTYISDNPVDACVEMVIKLKELNLL